MKKIILIFALLSSLLSYSYGLTEEIERSLLRFSNTVEFEDDDEGPPVEDPPVAPINSGAPYLMALGVLLAAGYSLHGRSIRRPD
jgi:hypothetical protein